MRQRTPLTACRWLACMAVAMAPLAAQAGFTLESVEDHTAVPVYRSYVLGGLGPDGSFAFQDNQFTGVDYLSNTAPLPMATANGSFTADGATLSVNGWSAYSGFYAARNYASMTVTNASADHVYYLVAGHGTTTSLQFFTPEAQSARAVFHWNVDGSMANSNPNGQGRAEPRLDFYATTTPGGSWFDLFNGSLNGNITQFGTGNFSYTLPVADLGETIYLYYWASAFTELQAGQATPGASFTMTADFGHTYTLQGIELQDEQGNPLSNWQALDANSGELLFNQSGRQAPILAAPVPEPQTWALWLAGLGVAGALRQRRRREH